MSEAAAATIVFSFVGISIAGWFHSLRMLYDRLRALHPAEYEKLGRPSAFSRNNQAARRATMEFLVSGRHRELGDARLARFGRMSLAWLCAVALTGIGAIVLACVFPPG